MEKYIMMNMRKGIRSIELKDGLLPVIGKSKETGTEINFLPDPNDL